MFPQHKADFDHRKLNKLLLSSSAKQAMSKRITKLSTHSRNGNAQLNDFAGPIGFVLLSLVILIISLAF